MSKKINQMLSELYSLYDEAINLTQSYDNTMATINLVEQDVNNLNYNREYIQATKHRLFTHHQALVVQRHLIDTRIAQYKAGYATVESHMDIICLSEDVIQWTDNYKAVIVESCMNVMSHIQLAQSQPNPTTV